MLSKQWACLAISFAMASTALAEIESGSELPTLTVEKRGELHLKGDEIEYKPWRSEQLTDDQRVDIVQYLAGRMSASKINKPFTDALKDREFPHDKHLVTTIINADDAMWGTSGFVVSELEGNKRKHPEASLVTDTKGVGAKQWNLKEKSSAVAVVAPNGEVLFFKDGALSEEEIQQALDIVAGFVN